MTSTTWSPDLRRPVYTMRVLCEVANERGIATSEILAGTAVTRATSTIPRPWWSPPTKSQRCAEF